MHSAKKIIHPKESENHKSKFSEKINLVTYMTVSGVLAVACYLVAGLAQLPLLGLLGCTVCGFAVGILWPGSISLSAGILPKGGTALFAFLALAGDLGGSVGPALVGTVSQAANNNLQVGVVSGVAFPILLLVCVMLLRKRYKKEK